MVYERWKKVYSLMLEKIKGQPKMEKLRVIHLFEADLNLLIGILWGRRLVANGEKIQAFSPEQWGSRKGKQAKDVLFMKKMSYLIAHLQVKDLGSFDNDAKACYDRIVVLLALLRSRQLGMPKNACKFLAKYLDEAEYYVKTYYGTSDTSHKCAHGVGQGNKGSPAMWLIISTLLMDIMAKVTDGGAIFTDPITRAEMQRLIDGFVDNTTIFKTTTCNPTDPDAVATLTRELKKAAQWWADVLWETGGKLELDKCFFYLLHWVFDEEGRPRLATTEELQAEI
jgi:hypothetical protein